MHVAHLIPVVSTPVLEIGKASMFAKPFYTADFQDDNIIDFQLPKPSPTISKAVDGIVYMLVPLNIRVLYWLVVAFGTTTVWGPPLYSTVVGPPITVCQVP